MYKVVWTICPKLGFLCQNLVHSGLEEYKNGRIGRKTDGKKSAKSA